MWQSWHWMPCFGLRALLPLVVRGFEMHPVDGVVHVVAPAAYLRRRVKLRVCGSDAATAGSLICARMTTARFDELRHVAQRLLRSRHLVAERAGDCLRRHRDSSGPCRPRRSCWRSARDSDGRTDRACRPSPYRLVRPSRRTAGRSSALLCIEHLPLGQQHRRDTSSPWTLRTATAAPRRAPPGRTPRMRSPLKRGEHCQQCEKA